MLLPLVYLVFRSAGATDETWGLIFSLRTAQILGRTVVLVAVVTGASVALAVPLAWLTARTDLPFRRAWAVLTVLPLVIPSYVGAFLAVSALGPKGLLQQFLSVPFGVDRLPDIYGLPGAAITLSLLSYPYILLTVRGVIVSLDPALEESARSLGHSPWRALLGVTLPQLRPSIAAGSLLVALYTLSDFGAVSLMRYETFTWAIYLQYESFDRSVAAVLSLILVGVAFGLMLMEIYARGRLRYFRTGVGSPRPPGVIRLGRWKWAAFAFCAAVVSAALVFPMALLVYWLVRGIANGEPLLLLWGSIGSSVYVSALAAIVASAAAIPMAVLVVRYPSIFSQALERASFVGFALPGIVVALALVFFGINFARPLYQTTTLLVFAYVVLFFPAALGATRSSMLQISPRLEDAARGLGRRQTGVIVSVTAPMMRSGVLMGAALVFLIAMKELPATLILGPLDFNTLATSIWSASSEAFFAQAAAPAITLTLMSSVPLTFLLLREHRLVRAARERPQP